MSDSDTTPTSSTESSSGATSQANLSLITSQALGIAAQNAVVAQQMGNIMHSAVTAVGVGALFANTQTTTSPKSLTQVLQEVQNVIDALKNIEGQSK
ncbi:MAG: RebB family R body protein [Xenococcus sp. MO_188.B8]|nr:RebB family R body protein [Xenococcus sp. MO_188.B8]